MTNREMRLRHLGLALVALTGIWIAVVIQRSHAPATSALASGPQPADVSAPRPKLVHVEGLSRPVAGTPIVKVRSHPHVATPAAPARVLDVQVSPLETTEPSSAGAVAIDEDTRAAAVTPLPPPTQAAFGLDAPTIWTQASSESLVEHEAVLTGLEFSTTYKVYLHAVDEWNRAQTTTLELTTGPMGDRTNARTSGDRILLDERPFFPVAVWGQCADGYGSNI